MNEQDVQIIEKDGEPEYAVVPIEEYRREDVADSAAIGRSRRDDSGRSCKGHARGRIVPADVKVK